MAGVYEWDEEKAAENLEKHGVAFSEAIQVFDDHSSVEEYDIDHSTPDESRFWRIGFSGLRLLLRGFHCPRGESPNYPRT